MTGPSDPERPDISAAELDEALGRVPRRVRRIFLLHCVDGLTYRQIADLLGISERRVERALVRALTSLRWAIKDIKGR